MSTGRRRGKKSIYVAAGLEMGLDGCLLDTAQPFAIFVI
jgi:hypothetical protein